MNLLEHGREKFPTAAILTSSSSLGWAGVATEVLSHPACELAPFTSTQTEVTITMRGTPGAFVHRGLGGLRQKTAVQSGTIWITPSGSREEATRITAPLEDVAHIYLSSELITSLNAEGGADRGPQSVGYLADVSDELIRQIGLALVSELRSPSAGGRVLAESLGLSLAARILQRHSSGGSARQKTDEHRYATRVDDVRIRRVVEFMMANLESSIGFNDLAAVACLSPFHFARTFRLQVGLPPHRFLSQLRLEHARTLLVNSERAIGDIALSCQFSSQSNFSRAFKDSTGMTPRQFREEA